MKTAFSFPFLGFIISFALLVLGHCLKENGAQANIYMLFGKFSYFYSGIFFLISIAALILKSNKKMKSSSTTVKSLSGLRELSWKDFNDYITKLFEKLGYSLVDKRNLNEERTDMKLKRGGRLSIVRCKKYYVRKVPLSMLLEFYKAIIREPDLEKGYFITTGFFSREARKFASEKQLELIDGVKLMDFVRIADSINAAEEKSDIQNSPKRPGYACPMCGAHMVMRSVNSNTHATHFWGCSAYPTCNGTLRSELGDLESLEY